MIATQAAGQRLGSGKARARVPPPAMTRRIAPPEPILDRVVMRSLGRESGWRPTTGLAALRDGSGSR